MPLIPTVGRRSARIRGLLLVIYVALCLGSLTTLYPFLIMLSSSVTSDYDQNDYNIVPAYLTSDKSLVAKYAEDKYDADLIALNYAYGTNFATLQIVDIPHDPKAAALVPRWRKFLTQLPAMYKITGFHGSRGKYVPSKLMTRYRTWLTQKYHGNIDQLSRLYVEEDTSFLSIFPPYERPTQRGYRPGDSPKDRDWVEFQKTLSLDWFQPIFCDPLFQAYLHDQVYPTGKIADLNAAWGTHYISYSQVMAPETIPANSVEARDWAGFVRHKLPLRFIVWRPGADAAWAKFLAHQPGSTKISLPQNGDLPDGPDLQAYSAFVASIDPKLVDIRSVENLWRADLADPHATIPTAEDDREFALSRKPELRGEFMARNYRFATDFLLLHGRGIWNTVIYCVGAVLLAIIVNPLCAYALSRFRLPYASGVLLFLLATMAFPAEVTMIPNFLLIKQLGLLNTFWALILPGAASGFSIFLLKGFFDSLPPELYEAGMLDGASEITLFSRVTLPLSGPIFAVIALQAFAGMYGAFLFAMTIEQAQSQWPLMVWIYEFQALAAPNYVMMAALVIAALPTLLVFLFAQNVIMKGIILPSYK